MLAPELRAERRRPVAIEHDEDLLLVRRMLAGEAAAFEVFGERYFRALHRFAGARLGGDRELVCEIVQTAVAKALRSLASYRGEAALLTWLCACCRNEIRMHFRRRRTAPVEVELEEGVMDGPMARASAPPDPEAELLAREEADLVHVVLDALPERYARALEWKYLERLTVEEIAERLGVGAKAAESLLGRARAAFRASFESLRAIPSDDDRNERAHGRERPAS